MPKRNFHPQMMNANEIHLWTLNLANTQPVFKSCLHSDEHDRYKNFSASVQARRYLVSRCAIRQILGNYLGVAPQDLIFSIQQGGKPAVDSLDCDLQFNLTHTKDVGLLAVTRDRAVGVDIEQIRPLVHRHKIARRIFSSAEIESLVSTPEASQDHHFFHLWTSMEARQKCFGQGIFGDKISQTRVGSYRFSPIAGYCAALAWEDPGFDPALQFFDFG